MKTLILTDPIPADGFVKAIHAIAPDIDLVEYRREITDAQLAQIDVVLGWRFPAGVAQRLPRLKWVCSVAAQFVAGLRCVQRGEPPPQQVDRVRGY